MKWLDFFFLVVAIVITMTALTQQVGDMKDSDFFYMVLTIVIIAWVLSIM